MIEEFEDLPEDEEVPFVCVCFSSKQCIFDQRPVLQNGEYMPHDHIQPFWINLKKFLVQQERGGDPDDECLWLQISRSRLKAMPRSLYCVLRKDILTVPLSIQNHVELGLGLANCKDA